MIKTYAFIFARGGSKGLKNKNIRFLSGKPLLAWSIELANKMPDVNKVFVSTDSKEIANISFKFGAEVIIRPKSLAKDKTPEWLAWKHAIEYLELKGEIFDQFISLPATAPLRSISDIQSCMKAFDSKTDIVVTMSRSTRSPWFNMVKKMKNGYIDLIIKNDKNIYRRQDAPEIFDLTTVAYLTRPSFIKKSNNIFEGNVKAIEIPAERAVDIDTELDFKFAEFLFKTNKENL
jgi:CMP-N-acetylneuraminic acid synthetase